MFGWLGHLLRRPTHEPQPEVLQGQEEQRRKFDVWEAAKLEVLRVQVIAERKHSDMHRPHRR